MPTPTVPIRLGVLALVTSVVALLGCSTVDEIINPPDPVPTSVQVSQATVALTALGATANLTATVRDQNGSAISGASVTWSSSNDLVATVSSSGTVTATGVGTATITAASGTLTGTSTVTVTQQPAEVGTVGGDNQTAVVGQALPVEITVQVNDAGGNPIPDLAVSFTVTQGGGTVSAASVPTDASGQASTTWTLGTGAGEQQVTATTAGGEATGTFTATGTPDVAASIAQVSGNDQQGPTSALLSDPIVVKVSDQFGNGVEGESVAFEVTGGGGSLLSTNEVTDADGEASTGWTLGLNEGLNTATASRPGLTGDPVMFSATATNLSVSGVSPDPMIEGAMATVTGTGFDTTPANNDVTVGGVTAAVTAATATTLDIVVPTFDCRPARDVDVVVAVSGVDATISHGVSPGAFLSVPVGEQVIISDPSDFCLQFDATGADERYLVGVTSVSELASSRTAVSLTSVTPSGSTVPPRGMTSRLGARQVRQVSSQRLRQMEMLNRHRVVEARMMEDQLRELAGLSPAVASGAHSAIPSDVQVGDTVMIRIPESPSTCTDFTELTTIARHVGTRGVWLEDLANDTAGAFTGADFQTFSDQLDGGIYDTDVQYFGDPTDLDGNGRIAAVITKEVQKVPGRLGFVNGVDIFTRAQCPSSDEGEIFYGAAPDSAISAASLRAFMGIIIAHEFVHIIQLSRRIAAGAPVFQSVWELEGGATFGEAQVGIATQGLNPVDIPNDIVWDFPDTAATNWYTPTFGDVAQYFGMTFTMSPPGRLSEAPWDCTWLDRSVLNDECTIDGREVYGVPATFLWWISDQFGPTFTGGVGGVEGIQQALINSTLEGFANIVATIGVPIDSLLAQWQAAMYMDNRQVDGMPVPTTARLTFTTWNFFSIFDGTQFSGTNAGMTPKIVGFGDSAVNINVRGGSSGYFLMAGMGRPATAVRARDAGDGTLSSIMRMWVARLK